MNGIWSTIEAPKHVCAGCNHPIQVHPKRGGAYVQTRFECVSPNGDVHEVTLTFHTWECLVSTYHVEKWDGNRGFIRWAADKVRFMLGRKVRELSPDHELKALEGGLISE